MSLSYGKANEPQEQHIGLQDVLLEFVPGPSQLVLRVLVLKGECLLGALKSFEFLQIPQPCFPLCSKGRTFFSFKFLCAFFTLCVPRQRSSLAVQKNIALYCIILSYCIFVLKYDT